MIREQKGTGAAGGIGYALKVAFDAKLVSGGNLVFEELEFQKSVKKCDILITGEGKVDHQTKMGKGGGLVANIAKTYKKPCICIGGSIANGKFHNFDGTFSIL